MGDEPTIDIDVNDILDDVPAEATAPEESSTTESEAAQPVEEETPTEAQDNDGEAPEDTSDNADEAPKPRSAEARKAQLTSEIQQLAAQRNSLKAEVEAANARTYQSPTAEELMDEGVDPQEARIQAIERNNELIAYNARVSELSFNLNAEAMNVIRDFPVFDPQSPSYDRNLADRARSVYEQAAQVQYDPNTGLPYQANAMPYNIYKAFADTHSYGAQNGQIAGQRAAEANLAAADTVSSSAPKAPKEDPFLTGLTRGLKLP